MSRVFAIGLFVLLAGCSSAAQEHSSAPPAGTFVAGPARAIDWSPGNWWAYRATLGNTTHEVALVLHGATPDGYVLGSNLSIGFFGLPFHGNVTPARNPRIGGEEWPLFELPLGDGKEWAYTLFGHDAKARARSATVDAPGGPVAGYQIEARSLGQLFARYTYADQVGWFTRLEVIEPTDGSTVLLAELTAYGPDWDQAYYVERTLHRVVVDYPALPGELEVRMPPGYVDVRVELALQVGAGALLATLRDAASGEPLVRASVLGGGFEAQRAAVVVPQGARWTFEHSGAGTGRVHLEVTGLAPSGPLAQSTRPAVPHDGQTTSTGAPVGSYVMRAPHLGHLVAP